MTSEDDDKALMSALTDEERAALAEADGADNDADDAEAKTETDSEAKAPADGADDADGEDGEDGEDDEPARPTDAPLKAEAPTDAGERLAKITADEESLEAKFEDGEITAREYRDGLRKLNDQREDVKWQQREADLAEKMASQARENAWNREVRDFMTTTGASIAKSEALMTGFDAVVRRVTGDPSNSGMSDRAMLAKAHRLFSEELAAAGIGNTKKDGAPVTGAAKKQRDVPPILARVPAADPEVLDGGKYAALERLAESNPIAYEKAVEKLSESEREQYLATG